MDSEFGLIVSKETIESVFEAYFNEAEFKRPVKVIDSVPLKDGYSFNLTHNTDAEQKQPVPIKRLSRKEGTNV